MIYEIRRGRRKTLSITVKCAKVIVNAPAFASNKSIELFVNSKKDWIEKHLKTQRDQEEQKKIFNPEYGSEILFLGTFLTLEEAEVKKVCPADGKLLLPCGLKRNEFKNLIRNFYRKEAGKLIRKKTQIYSELMGARPTSIRITEARTRWGSCSGKGNLNFSWYLIMASEAQIDYVIVHELAHLKEMNHSGRFWKIVERYVPDHKAMRQQLKILNQRLLTEDWKTSADI